jgi:hypothetical protein
MLFKNILEKSDVKLIRGNMNVKNCLMIIFLFNIYACECTISFLPKKIKSSELKRNNGSITTGDFNFDLYSPFYAKVNELYFSPDLVNIRHNTQINIISIIPVIVANNDTLKFKELNSEGYVFDYKGNIKKTHSLNLQLVYSINQKNKTDTITYNC